MKRLTFKGFLRKYVRALSGMETNDLRRLAAEVSSNYRLVEPLVLFAMSVNRLGFLQRVAKDMVLVKAVQLFLEIEDWEGMLHKLENSDDSIPYEYHKVYNSYISVRDRSKAKNHTKELMHTRIKYLQKEKNVSTYRLYTDLGLNHGNVNAYIKYGDASKVSLEVAEKVLDYLTSK